MKIGIFGGTFNPIHLGHTALASYICNLGLVDEVWLMVSPQNPFKQDHQLLDEAVRLRLATLAVRDFPRLRASDFEFHLPRPSYTYVTLQELSRAYPDDAFSLIIGADNWDAFPKWRNADDILAHYPIIVYPRETSPNPSPLTPNPKTPPTNCQLPIVNCQFLNSAPLYPISSTAIRTAIAAGDDVSPWLDPAVLDEIRRLRLYAQ